MAEQRNAELGGEELTSDWLDTRVEESTPETAEERAAREAAEAEAAVEAERLAEEQRIADEVRAEAEWIANLRRRLRQWIAEHPAAADAWIAAQGPEWQAGLEAAMLGAEAEQLLARMASDEARVREIAPAAAEEFAGRALARCKAEA